MTQRQEAKKGLEALLTRLRATRSADFSACLPALDADISAVEEALLVLSAPTVELVPYMSAPVYTVNGRPYRLCECPRGESKCVGGWPRTVSTTEYSRCLVPVPELLTFSTIAVGVAK